MEQFFRVGVITSTHGIRGEVKVYPTTDDPQRFKKLKKVILDDGKQRLDMEVASVKFFKNMVILKFKGIDNINDVEKYKQADLLVTRENAVKLEEGEYFIADLYGLDVIDADNGQVYGKITDVVNRGASDIYIVDTPNGERMIPVVDEFVDRVDVNEGVFIRPIEGMLD